jgi:SAM-dependent methyltransferase
MAKMGESLKSAQGQIKLRQAKKKPQGADWTKWPKWTGRDKFKTPNFSFNCSVSDYSGKTCDWEVALLKDRQFIDIYRKLAMDTVIKNVFEIGFFQGGMPLFLADMIRPRKTVAIDRGIVSPQLQELISKHKLSRQIELITGVNQEDTVKLRSIVKSRFGDEPLDLIIDDCSHYYSLTKACFEQLFGFLRPGGKYIIEDWGWTHWPGAPWQTKDSHFNGMPSMSNLVFEIIMAFASNKDLIANIEFPSWACIVITKGKQLKHGEVLDLAAVTNIAGGRSAPLIVEPSVTVAPAAKTPIESKPIVFEPPKAAPRTWRSVFGI